jgi:hypothetical protein
VAVTAQAVESDKAVQAQQLNIFITLPAIPIVNAPKSFYLEEMNTPKD